MIHSTIHKDRVILQDSAQLRLPVGTKILRISKQFDDDATAAYIWYTVPSNPFYEYRTLYIVGTGHPIGHVQLEWFIGTELFAGGSLVLHFFLEPGALP